jgi:hypothetical protein
LLYPLIRAWRIGESVALLELRRGQQAASQCVGVAVGAADVFHIKQEWRGSIRSVETHVAAAHRDLKRKTRARPQPDNTHGQFPACQIVNNQQNLPLSTLH